MFSYVCPDIYRIIKQVHTQTFTNKLINDSEYILMMSLEVFFLSKEFFHLPFFRGLVLYGLGHDLQFAGPNLRKFQFRFI